MAGSVVGGNSCRGCWNLGMLRSSNHTGRAGCRCGRRLDGGDRSLARSAVTKQGVGFCCGGASPLSQLLGVVSIPQCDLSAGRCLPRLASVRSMDAQSALDIHRGVHRRRCRRIPVTANCENAWLLGIRRQGRPAHNFTSRGYRPDSALEITGGSFLSSFGRSHGVHSSPATYFCIQRISSMSRVR